MRIWPALSYFIYNTALLLPRTALASHNYFVTGSQQFIIVDSGDPQLYKVFGFLPFLHTLKAQVTIATIFAVIIGLPLFLFFYLRPRHPYADWTSRLPDSIVNLLFYLQIEAVAYKEVLITDIMAVLTSPLSIGLDIASNVSFWDPLGLKGKRGRGTGTGFSSRTGRAALRRKQDHAYGLKNGAASGSKSQLNGHYPSHYPGLYNTGNSCFLNSTLQSLASLDVLKQHLESVMELAETWDVPTPVIDALHDLVLSLNTSGVKRSALIPRQLTDALSSLPQTNVGSFFYAHQQQDAHELMVLLTSAIDDEMSLVLAERDYVQRRQAIGLRAAVAPSVPSLYSLSSFASTSANPFRSLIAQRTACLDCGYVEAVRHYPADELSLGVPFRAGSATTLESCLASWSKLERVDWICFRCSLEKTLEKVRADLKRMTSGSTNGQMIEGVVNGNGSAVNGSISNGSSKPSNSKKKKLKEVRRKETVLAAILEGRFSEDEVEASHLLEKASVKLERAFSSLSTKQVMIARTPKILILHLNRSSYNASNYGASKNNTPVLFDEYLDIGNVVTNGELNVSGNLPISRGPSPARDSNGQAWPDRPATNGYHHQIQPFSLSLYRLCAIVVHYGSHSAGHYISFRRRELRQGYCSSPGGDEVDQQIGEEGSKVDAWFRISDDSVSPCSLDNVLSQNPFLMFYERVEEVQRPGRKSLAAAAPKENGAMLPKGFEAYGRDELQKKINTYHPRVVERWNVQ
jgi:ubiquitin carboxyl-terminal hydrolase 1